MTQNEMIDLFKKQLEEVVARIKELDQELNLKTEEYFKLTGAVQALELAAKESETPTVGGTIADTTPPAPPADGMVPPQVTSKGVIQ